MHLTFNVLTFAKIHFSKSKGTLHNKPEVKGENNHTDIYADMDLVMR